MSEALHETHNEFWRPPAAQPAPVIIPQVTTIMVEACDRCETEFMVGARFCYLCGAVRKEAQAASPFAPTWTRYLEFHQIKQALGLSLASLMAFLLGLGALLAAAFVGTFYSVQNFADFQAVQFWRMQWLLAAIAFFVAAVLLKRAAPSAK